MNAADILREEINKKNQDIIATKFAPNRDAIIKVVSEGIKRIGYVEIDTSAYDTSTLEGRMCGVYKAEELQAFKEFVQAEGFNATLQWWGLSTNGLPDMIKITL